MRTIFIGLAAGAMLAASASTASADNQRWCQTGRIGESAATRCDFYTLAQCQATISGVGGSCIENPDYAGGRRTRGQGRGRDDH